MKELILFLGGIAIGVFIIAPSMSKQHKELNINNDSVKVKDGSGRVGAVE